MIMNRPKASLTFSGHKATAGIASKFCRLNLQSKVWAGIGKHYYFYNHNDLDY